MSTSTRSGFGRTLEIGADILRSGFDAAPQQRPVGGEAAERSTPAFAPPFQVGARVDIACTRPCACPRELDRPALPPQRSRRRTGVAEGRVADGEPAVAVAAIGDDEGRIAARGR